MARWAKAYRRNDLSCPIFLRPKDAEPAALVKRSAGAAELVYKDDHTGQGRWQDSL